MSDTVICRECQDRVGKPDTPYDFVPSAVTILGYGDIIGFTCTQGHGWRAVPVASPDPQTGGQG